jgi:hypothetical protein
MEREGYRSVAAALGRMGNHHLRVLDMRPGVQAAAVVDPSRDSVLRASLDLPTNVLDIMRYRTIAAASATTRSQPSR